MFSCSSQCLRRAPLKTTRVLVTMSEGAPDAHIFGFCNLVFMLGKVPRGVTSQSIQTFTSSVLVQDVGMYRAVVACSTCLCRTHTHTVKLRPRPSPLNKSQRLHVNLACSCLAGCQREFGQHRFFSSVSHLVESVPSPHRSHSMFSCCICASRLQKGHKHYLEFACCISPRVGCSTMRRICDP